LPPDAAKVLFGRESTPAAGPPQAIGSYERGCLSGAIALPADGPNWQVMRPSRNRAWGHPVLIAFSSGWRTNYRVRPAGPGFSSVTSISMR
jgi:penicillin-insensitive murein endopeptidase